MGEKKNGGEAGRGDGKKKEKRSSTVVLKVGCLCQGCADKIVKYSRRFEGVENVKTDDSTNKVTVIGAVDPEAIKKELEDKTKKKVDLISPQPKKDDTKDDKKKKKPDQEKKPDSENKQKKKPKDREAQVTTVDLKVQLTHQYRIRKIVSETEGVHKQEKLITDKRTMHVKASAEDLKGKHKKHVEIVPRKKEKDGNIEGGEKSGRGGGGKKKNTVVEMEEKRLLLATVRWRIIE